MSEGQPAAAGAAISLRQTLPNSKWRGVTCPKCGNTLSEGEQVVLCPKCYTPQHAQCWRDNGNQCAVDQAPARIIERPGRTSAGAPATPTTVAADTVAPTSATPAPPTPSMDTAAAAAAAPATRTATAGGAPARPAPPRPVPGAAAGGAARPAGRAAAGPTVKEARGLRTLADVRQRLESVLGDLEPQFAVAIDEVTCTVPAPRILEAARRAKEHDQLRYDYLRCLSGVDYETEGIEVVYHLFSMRLLQKCCLKARVSGEGQSLPSVTSVWAGANWHEREAAEMFNVTFEGHPHLEPLLLQKDEEGRIVPGPILLKRFPLRPKEPPGVYGFPEEE